jgi:hypothetical protein
MIVSIPRDEWIQAIDLTSFIGGDHAVAAGYVRVFVHEGQRQWLASDGTTGLHFAGAADHENWTLNIPIMAFAALKHNLIGVESVDIHMDDESPRTIISSSTAEFSFDRLVADHAATFSDWSQPTNGATVTVNRELLQQTLRPRPIDPVNSDGEKMPVILGCCARGLTVSAHYTDTGYSQVLIPGDHEGSELELRLYVNQLMKVIQVLKNSEECSITVPGLAAEPLHIECGIHTALVMPIKTLFQSAIDHVRIVISEALGNVALERDDDGDYPLRRHGVPIYGRFHNDNRPLFQVFAVVLDGVDESPELFAELNSLNANLQQARVFHVEDQVLAEVDLVAESLDGVELMTAMDRIQKFAESIAPTLRVVFGGEDSIRPEEFRWMNYRSTSVSAEVSPAKVEVLTGETGVIQWPFPGAIFVLTGWNPQGVNRSGDYTNSLLARDVLQQGGRVVLGYGTSSDGEYVEPSIIAWGVDLDFARDLGRRADQEAIFMIDEENVYLTACFYDRTEHWPRLSNSAESEN